MKLSTAKKSKQFAPIKRRSSTKESKLPSKKRKIQDQQVRNPDDIFGGGRWTKEEDILLRTAVDIVGPRNWKRISTEFLSEQRSDVQCLHRWQKVLRPGLVKGPWTKEEDDSIMHCISNGMTKWSEIAALIPGRIGKQCRERWFNHLDPTIKKGEWTLEEDAILLKSQSSLGNKWCEIAKLLPGRSENSVKNRWNSAIRKKMQAALQDPLYIKLNQQRYEEEQEEIHVKKEELLSLSPVPSELSQEEAAAMQLRSLGPQDCSKLPTPSSRSSSTSKSFSAPDKLDTNSIRNSEMASFSQGLTNMDVLKNSERESQQQKIELTQHGRMLCNLFQKSPTTQTGAKGLNLDSPMASSSTNNNQTTDESFSNSILTTAVTTPSSESSKSLVRLLAPKMQSNRSLKDREEDSQQSLSKDVLEQSPDLKNILIQMQLSEREKRLMRCAFHAGMNYRISSHHAKNIKQQRKKADKSKIIPLLENSMGKTVKRLASELPEPIQQQVIDTLTAASQLTMIAPRIYPQLKTTQPRRLSPLKEPYRVISSSTSGVPQLSLSSSKLNAMSRDSMQANEKAMKQEPQEGDSSPPKGSVASLLWSCTQVAPRSKETTDQDS